MKRIIMMMAVAVGFTAFADANDPLIPANVEAGRTYALLCKGELVRNYTANATMEMNFQGDAKLSADAADYEVVLVGGTFELDKFICTYSTGAVFAKGERLLLVKCTKGFGFKGLNWDGTPVDAANNEIIWTGTTADANGKFALGELPEVEADQFDYQFIVLDTRLPNGEIGSDAAGKLKVVCGWGEFVSLGNDLSTTSIRWNKVTIGLTGTAPDPYNKKFDFDPTLYLANGFATVSPSEGVWEVYQLPQAWVDSYESEELKKGDNYHHLRAETVVPTTFKLESAYKFSAFDTDLEDVALKYLRGEALTDAEEAEVFKWYNQVQPFWGWNADFEVSFDREVEADSVILAGWYDYVSAWGSKYSFDWTGTPWVGSSPSEKFVPGVTEPIRLLKSYIGQAGAVTMTYEEICTKVIQFLCGVKNLSEKNYGTTMTVKLCIYENTGRCHESGRRIEIGTYEYTFCGPLTVKFNKGPEHEQVAELKDVDLPENFTTNFDGKAAILLPVPKYEGKIENWAFVGWSNSVDLVNLVYVPTNTWGDLELWSVWKKAQTTQVAPTGGTAKVDIKVTQEWIDENVGKDATKDQINAVLNETKEVDGGTIPVWQTYVLGLNPSGTVEVVATEKKSEDTALVVSTVQAPPPDSGFKVTYSLDKIDKTTEKPIDDAHKGVEQDTKDIEIPLAVEEGGETPTGYYKMNVFITPVESGKEEEKVQVKSETTVGVLTVETEEKVIPVAVPWTSLAVAPDEKAEIPADEIVQPQGLADGDLLHVYNGDAYTTLVLKGGKWTKGNNVIVGEGGSEVLDGEIPSVARGSAMWLERKTDTGKPFHLFGQYNKTAASTTIKAPAKGSTKPEYNLIAPTGIEETDINQVINHDIGANDRLMIVDKGAPVYYSYDGTAWGYNRQEIATTKNGKTIVRTVRTTDAKVSAGIGLWYISNGGEPTINWNK